MKPPASSSAITPKAMVAPATAVRPRLRQRFLAATPQKPAFIRHPPPPGAIGLHGL